jgi:hypothetical protein
MGIADQELPKPSADEHVMEVAQGSLRQEGGCLLMRQSRVQGRTRLKEIAVLERSRTYKKVIPRPLRRSTNNSTNKLNDSGLG